MATYNKIHAFICLLIFSFVVPTLASANSDYSRLAVFGDSLSDPGNAFVITGMATTPPYTLAIPDYPYARGGLHLSNGSTWIEQLAERMRLAQSVGPALRVTGGFSNYATDRTRACPDSVLPSHIDLTQQVSMFLEEFLDENDRIPGDALYILFVGSNDVRDAAENLAQIPCALTSIADNLNLLISKGARYFLVANVPNLGLIPALLGTPDQGPATFASESFNQALENILSSIEAATQGLVTFYRLDTFSLLTDVYNNPPGDLNVTNSCINIITGRACAPTSGYLYWDYIHPTVTGHALLAEEAASVLGLQ